MKKNYLLICMALIAALCVGNLSAQTERVNPQATKVQQETQIFNADLSSAALPSLRGSGDPVMMHIASGGAARKGTVADPFGAQIGTTPNIQATEYVDGEIYGNVWSGGNRFGKVNVNTGAWTLITSWPCDAASMSYNPVDGKLYCFPWTAGDTDGPVFGTVNPATGAFTTITTFAVGSTNTFYAAIDEDGTCYAAKNGTNEFGTINLTDGTFTLIATVPFQIAYIQDMSFDRETGELYWLSQYLDGQSSTYYKVNKTTGALTQVLPPNTSMISNCFTIMNWYGEGGEDCPAVTNVTATQFEANKVKVNWTAATGDVANYKIYQDNVEKATVAAGTTTWTSDALANGTYTFAVAATYADDCVPVKVAAAPIEIKTCSGVVSNLEVAYAADCGKATITWDATAKGRDYEGWIKHCVDDVITGRVGYSATSGNDMTVAIRFTASDLAALGVVNGQTITKIALGIGTDMAFVNSMEIRIWEGGTSLTDGGTLKHTEPITGWQSFPENTMRELELATPYVIDATKELRIGWRLINTMGYPFGRDAGPAVIQKGTLFQCPAINGGAWICHHAYFTPPWNYNYSIKAFVTESGVVLDPEYNVYRDGVKIAGPIEEITFEDITFDKTKPYTWSVAVACSNGGDGEWVNKSMPACATTCDPVTNGAVAFSETAATITWTAVEGAKEYKVSRGDFSATVTNNEAIEEGEFIIGTAYTWTVITICEGGESTPAEITGTPVSIKNNVKDGFSIVPNPAISSITIAAGNNFHTIEVINFLGQTVISQFNASETATLDVSALTNGVYFVRIISDNGTSVKKFVKQ